MQKINTKHKIVAKPFLKWAGGKSQLLPSLADLLPADLTRGNINKYIEPFLGGGAMFFYIAQKFDINEIYLSDINKELINAYRTIQKEPLNLIDKLKQMNNTYQSAFPERRKYYFLKIRSMFNKLKNSSDYANNSRYNVERTAQLIFLNKTCYNGLFRVNSKGEFNVPFGNYKNPKILDEENILNISKLLKNVILLNNSYEKCEEVVSDKSFVYFDPPYRPISKTSAFTSYSKNDFTENDHEELAQLFRRLNSDTNAKLMLSNSDPSNTNTSDIFYSEHYGEFNLNKVFARRSISCNSDNRGMITELVITNY